MNPLLQPTVRPCHIIFNPPTIAQHLDGFNPSELFLPWTNRSFAKKCRAWETWELRFIPCHHGEKKSIPFWVMPRHLHILKAKVRLFSFPDLCYYKGVPHLDLSRSISISLSTYLSIYLYLLLYLSIYLSIYVSIYLSTYLLYSFFLSSDWALPWYETKAGQSQKLFTNFACWSACCLQASYQDILCIHACYSRRLKNNRCDAPVLRFAQVSRQKDQKHSEQSLTFKIIGLCCAVSSVL